MSKFKAGDKVEVISIQSEEHRGDCDVEVGKIGTVCEVTDYCDDEIPYLIDFGENTTRWWFGEDNLKLYEEEVKQPTSYREMSPDSTVKVKIGDYESEVCVGDLVHTTALLAVTNGCYGEEVWEFLKNALGGYGFIEDINTTIEFREKEKQSLEHFFKPFYEKQEEKDLLLKDIEEYKAIIKNNEELLKKLEVKYNSYDKQLTTIFKMEYSLFIEDTP